jgi:hypothetical protein
MTLYIYDYWIWSIGSLPLWYKVGFVDSVLCLEGKLSSCPPALILGLVSVNHIVTNRVPKIPALH